MIGTVLAIIGIILTIIFGIYSIWIYKKTKKTISLEFQNKECYSLFDDEINHLNIKLLYNENTLSNTIILLKAKLINNGQIDIDKNRIFSPIKILCTEKFKWLEVNIISQSDGTSANIQQNSENEIQVDWNLLKKDEFIEIEALIEVIINEDIKDDKAIQFYNELTFDFRITDLNLVHKENQESKHEKRIKSIKSLNKVSTFVASVSILVGAFTMFSGFYPNLSFVKKSKDINYLINDGNISKVYTIQSKSNNTINITENNTSNSMELSLNEFNNKYKIVSINNTINSEKKVLLDKIVGLILLVLGFILFFLNRRLNKKYNKTE